MSDRPKATQEKAVYISVILPVFRVEPWIGRCIESLKRQTMTELEFIFVDDCTDDASMAAVEVFSENDDRVRILRNEKNLGPGPSRNRGIEAAVGEYLSFVDPDDWIGEDFYELLWARARKMRCNIVKGTRVSVGRGAAQSAAAAAARKQNRHMERLLRLRVPLFDLFTFAHQSAIYKKAFLDEQPSVRYGTSSNAQDTTFLLRLCMKTEEIAFENRAVYYYDFHSEAATGGFSYRRVWGELQSLGEKIDTVQKVTPDRSIYHYLAQAAGIYFSNFYIACREGNCSAEQTEAYLKVITEQLSRIPDKKNLTKKYLNLDAVLRYGAVLPYYKIRNVLRFQECLEKWSVFLKIHPEAGRQYSKACADLLVRAWAESVLDRCIRKDRTMMRPETVSSLNRLDARRKSQILLYLPGSAIRLIGEYMYTHL